MRVSGIGLIALALIGVIACERKGEEQAGQTTTTSGESEQQRAAREAEEQKNLPGAVPLAPTGESAASEAAKLAEQAKIKAEEAAKKTEEKVDGTSKGVKEKATAKTHPMVKKTVIVKKVIKPKAKEEPTSTTTITEVEIETVPPRQLPTQPLETPAAPATPPHGMPLPTAETGQPYINTSTTLGNGNSGEYTGGQGTYGGRATWGTCCGVQAYPPVPQPYPPPAKK